MREPTAHEIADKQRIDEREQNAARRTQRQDLRRACPVNRVVDSHHLVALIHEGPSSNRSFLLWRHFVAVGMRAEGYIPSQVCEALQVSPAELDALYAPIPNWQVPEDTKRRFPLLFPELVTALAPYAVPAGAPREDYPIVATSGWRTSSPIEPGTRRRTLGEDDRAPA